jgi:hypothetical protein
LRIDSLQAHDLLNPGVTIPDEVVKSVPKGFEYNLYVTPDHLVRRVRFGLLGKVTVINYTGWGSAIHVVAPAAADLVPAPAGF